MLTITCTLGLDAEDAALNRPVVVLTPAETAELLPLLPARAMPLLEALIGTADGQRRAFGMSQLPALQGELRAALAEIAAVVLADRLIVALALQRLATACETALEFGMNLYVRAEG